MRLWTTGQASRHGGGITQVWGILDSDWPIEAEMFINITSPDHIWQGVWSRPQRAEVAAGFCSNPAGATPHSSCLSFWLAGMKSCSYSASFWRKVNDGANVTQLNWFISVYIAVFHLKCSVRLTVGSISAKQVKEYRASVSSVLSRSLFWNTPQALKILICDWLAVVHDCHTEMTNVIK